MASANAFNGVLRAHGLPPAYRFDADVHRAQQPPAGSLTALEAFRLGLPALFEPCRIDPNRDGFAAMVQSQPERFALRAWAGADQLQAVIRYGLAADPDLSVILLPAAEEPMGPYGIPPLPAGVRGNNGHPLDLVHPLPRVLSGACLAAGRQ